MEQRIMKRQTMKQRTSLVGLLLAALLPGCLGGGGSAPAVKYYALSPPGQVTRGAATTSIAVEELRADAPYDERRIVYRPGPYRVSYYEYDQWAAAPGALVADYLRRAYQASGRFRMVLSEPAADTGAILGGRVLAFEEVDVGRRRQGRITVELELRDAESGRILWTRRAEQTVGLARRSPEALAAALTQGLARIAASTAGEIAAASAPTAAVVVPH
jgi:ABC-type uncharacterized transport system auxiliary subunit